MTYRWSVLAGSLAITLTACTYSPGLYDRTIDYNKSIADSTNALLLLNTLRARDRLPTYYTRSTGDTTTSTITPTLSAALPFGAPIVNPKTSGQILTAGLSASEGSQLALQNLDDQKYMRGTLTPIQADVLGFYLQQGWPAEVLMMVTVSKITFNASALNALVDSFTSICRNNPGGQYCDATLPTDIPPVQTTGTGSGEKITDIVLNCAKNQTARGSTGNGDYAVTNYPTNPAELSCFQAMVRLLIALGPEKKQTISLKVLSTDLPRSKEFSPADVAALDKQNLVLGSTGKSFVVCRRTTTSALALARLSASAPAAFASQPAESSADAGAAFITSAQPGVPMQNCGALAAGEKPASSDQIKVALTMRSFDGMVYYLGEVLRARDSGMNTTVWTFARGTGHFEEWTLFEAGLGSLWGSKGEVSVDYKGGTYIIPSSCSDAESCAEGQEKHHSLQVLALLDQIWGLEKEEATQPLVPTVTVINP